MHPTLDQLDARMDTKPSRCNDPLWTLIANYQAQPSRCDRKSLAESSSREICERSLGWPRFSAHRSRIVRRRNVADPPVTTSTSVPHGFQLFRTIKPRLQRQEKPRGLKLSLRRTRTNSGVSFGRSIDRLIKCISRNRGSLPSRAANGPRLEGRYIPRSSAPACTAIALCSW